MARSGLGRFHSRRLDQRDRRLRRGDQPRWSQRQLPLHTSESPRDDRVARPVDACGRRGDRPGEAPTARLAPGQHRHDLAHRYDAPNDEATGLLGGDEASAPSSWRFSIEVARAWERALDEAATPLTRKVALRSAMTMSPDRGGIFDTLLGLVRRGLGGVAGDGRQFISWIHHADFVRAVRWLIDHDELDGVVNVCAPHPLPNREFMRLLREAAGAPIGLPASRLMLEIGALFMRTETELILKSRRVVPTRLLESGFEFSFPNWGDAAFDLYGEWKSARQARADVSSAPAPARCASAYRSA